MDKDLITDKGTKSSKEIADFLRSVADKIDSGSMNLSRGSTSLDLEFPDRMGFRFKVKDDISRSGTQRKVQIGFRWDKDKKAKEKSADLIIK
ncbi:MAG: amphi-Trp domain-containing protein [Gammaproteobacteria bacterium]|nr:amphi-Trp domain-containing protein [Gammaproteobacteria bacterium]